MNWIAVHAMSHTATSKHREYWVYRERARGSVSLYWKLDRVIGMTWDTFGEYATKEEAIAAAEEYDQAMQFLDIRVKEKLHTSHA